MANEALIQKWLEMGGTEWQNDNQHRIYFNGLALRKLYGLYTEGEKSISEEQAMDYKEHYKTSFLPPYPETAYLKGVPIVPEEAFGLLLSRPYFDVETERFYGLEADISDGITGGNPLLAKCLSIGGREWMANENHRVYFGERALKDLYGMKTEGERQLSDEGVERYKVDYNTKFLPKFPETATLGGHPIDAQAAFELLLSRPYLDVQTGSFVGLKAPLSQRMEYSSAEQMKSMLAEAASQGSLPWDRALGSKNTKEVPFNPMTGESYYGNNLVATVLHMQAIGSKDPRYVKAEDVKPEQIKENAASLKVCYRVKDEKSGEYTLKTEDLYNASQLMDVPEYRPTRAFNRENILTAAQSNEPKGQMINNIAAYLAALKTGKGYEPAQPALKTEDYLFLAKQSTRGMFALLHEANQKGSSLMHGMRNSRENVREQQPAAMEM